MGRERGLTYEPSEYVKLIIVFLSAPLKRSKNKKNAQSDADYIIRKEKDVNPAKKPLRLSLKANFTGSIPTSFISQRL